MKQKLLSLLSAALLLTSCAASTANPPLMSVDQTTGSPIPTDTHTTTDLPFTTNPPKPTTNPNLTTEIPETADQSDVTEPPITTDAPSTQTSSSGETTESTVPDVSTQPVTGPESSGTTAVGPAATAPHVHSWGGWTVTKAASCTTAGSREHSCSACGAVESETLPATGHSFGAWKTTKAATCTAAGSREHSCTACGTTASETVPATGHQWSGWTVTKAATIHEEGEEYRTCASCQKKESRVIPIYVPTEAEKKAMALKVAQEIADSIGPGSDIDRVAEAAMIVSDYCQNRCIYTTEGKDYKQAYGVFIKGEYSCAGATRALGMVLECMGYKWTHANENQWSHQWCILEMDGQIGYADGQVGWVGYGSHPAADW